MFDRLLFIHTSIGKIETTMTVDEASKEIRDAKIQWRLATIKKPKSEARLDEAFVNNEPIMYINLDETKIYGYEDNYFSSIEQKNEEE